MAPEIDGAMYGIKRFSYSKEWDFKPYNQPRNTCNQLRVNSDFYVYREASHGFDGIMPYIAKAAFSARVMLIIHQDATLKAPSNMGLKTPFRF